LLPVVLLLDELAAFPLNPGWFKGFRRAKSIEKHREKIDGQFGVGQQ